MNNLRNILLILVAWAICAFQASAAEESKPKPPDPMTATLFPGETLTYQGVSVTWVVEPGEQRPKSDTGITTPTGHLKFVGPTAKLDSVPLPFQVTYIGEPGKPGRRPSWDRRMIGLYLDEVLVWVDGKLEQGGSRAVTLMRFQEKENHFDAAFNESLEVYLSYLCPVRLNQWELTLSEKPVRYPDGSEFFQITARNTETGEKVMIPATSGALKKAGRFTFQIGELYPETRTVVIRLSAEKDLSIRGRDAYAEITFPQMMKYGEFLNSLTQKYGFEIEWVPYPENQPESVEFAKNTTPRRGYPSNRNVGVLGNMLKQYFTDAQTPLAHEWRDATHLRVWAADYARVAEEKKAKEAAQAEEERIQAETSQELEKLKASFHQKYNLLAKTYVLGGLGAKTAAEYLRSEFQFPRSYYLFHDCYYTDLAANEFYPRDARLPLLEKGKYHFVTSVPVEELKQRSLEEPLRTLLMGNLKAQVTESVLVDERSNSLIVSTIPQTQARISDLLSQLDQMIDTRAAAGPILRFRVEVVLLRGRKDSAEVAEGIPLSFQVNGIITEISVRPGAQVKTGDVIARLDASDIRSKYETLKLEGDKNKSRYETELRKLDIAKAREKAGVTEGAQLMDAEMAAKEAQYALARNEIEMENLQDQMGHYTLQSPSDGIVNYAAGRLRPGLPIQSGDLVVTLIPAAPSADKAEKPGKEAKNPEKVVEKKPEKKEPTLAERYGISAEDMQLLGAKSLSEMGRGVLSLSGDKGETGRAVVNLTPQYQCELQYQDFRSPYLIARARLQSPAASGGAAKPVIENTVYLEPGKPSAEGITNLSEALILVVQLHDIAPIQFGQMPEGEQEVTLKTGLPYRKVGPLVLSLREVSANDAQNDRDDTCVLDVTTSTGGTATVALDEGGPAQFVEDWRFQATDVRPTSGAKNGEGTARIRIFHARPPVGGQVKKKAPVDPASMPQGDQEVALNTSSRDMKKVGPLSLRLRRVNANDPKNNRDDTCELIANTDTQSMTITLDESGATQFVEDWRFQAIDVQPTSGTKSGEGTARIRIKYVPAGARGQDTGTGSDLIPPGGMEVTLNTSSRDMKNLGPLSLRLRRVNGNDARNDRDDTCELIVNTDTQSMTITLEEGGLPKFVEDWRFQAMDVRPTGGANSTQGTARIRISRPSAGT